MVIQHNLLAMNANNQLKNTSNRLKVSTERLSSGYRINRAADDAAGLSISEKMRMQIRGLNQGSRNIQDGIDFVKIGDGAMAEISDILNRLEELAVHSANGTLTQQDRDAIQDEAAMLKKEINGISHRTTFNTIPIFLQPECEIDLEGMPSNFKIFDSSYDYDTREVEYGGFILNGERHTWDAVGVDVYVDDEGKQRFHEGEYDITVKQSTFHVSCAEGDEVPRVTRRFDIQADRTGVTIDGEKFAWDQIKDEMDHSIENNKSLEAGTYTLDYYGATFSFSLADNLEQMEDFGARIDTAANVNGEYQYIVEEVYSEPQDVKAVDLQNSSVGHVTNAVKVMYKSNLKFYIGCDKDGIWLKDASKNDIAGSKKTWAQMGISSWNSGDDIAENLVYTYKDDSGASPSMLELQFALDDVTSVDSVIDGLNDVAISVTTDSNYSVHGDEALDQVTSFTISGSRFHFGVDKEDQLGRDFDTAKDTLSSSNLNLMADGKTLKATFFSAPNAYEYTGDISVIKDNIQSAVHTYADDVADGKVSALLRGDDPDTAYSSRTLADLVGTSNITTAGYFNDVITITADMNLTDGSGFFAPGAVGNTYPAAHVDFSGLGVSYTLDDLNHKGFNSTCKTCSNHYSVRFTTESGNSLSSGGYAYSMFKDGNNYTLNVDLNSLAAKGVSSGSNLTNALIDILKEAYDFHYSQYAAKGGVLYVYDDRSQAQEAPEAYFDYNPYQARTEINGKIHMESNADDLKQYAGTDAAGNPVYKPATLDISLIYDYADTSDYVKVAMQEDALGAYVSRLNVDGEKGYILYDSLSDAQKSALPSGEKRYSLETYYVDPATHTKLSDASDFAKSYASWAADEIANKTTLDFMSDSYTGIHVEGDEHDNVAVESLFEPNVYLKSDTRIPIQCSGRKSDVIYIDRFTMTCASMGIGRLNLSTQGKALNALSQLEKAHDYVSARRSQYGAKQNRLEHAYNINQITAENTTAAESRIRDTDMAKEMTIFSNLSILMQAGQSVLAQANQSKLGVLSLLS